jgi:ATP-dependent protease ClpP protease subunit
MDKFIGIVLCIFLVSVAHAEDRVAAATISISSSSITYEGEIDWEGFNKVVSLYAEQNKKPALLKINSKGGEVLSGIAFGNWIREHRLSVEVTDYCFSSCANYIFPAGKRKILNPQAALYWHGGAFQKLKPDSELIATQSTENDQTSYQTRFEQAEQKFYKNLRVDANLPTYGQSASCWNRHRLNDYAGFFYSIGDMKKMGLTNISVKDGQWQPEVKRSSALNLFQVQPVKGKECDIKYQLQTSILYGTNSTQDIVDAIPLIMADGLANAMDKMDFFTLENMIFEQSSERLIFIKRLTDDSQRDEKFWTDERARLIADCKSGEGKGVTKLENFILSNSPLIETWHRYMSADKVVQELSVGKSDCITF